MNTKQDKTTTAGGSQNAASCNHIGGHTNDSCQEPTIEVASEAEFLAEAKKRLTPENFSNMAVAADPDDYWRGLAERFELQRDHYKAQAEALAEALRHLMAITRNESASQYKAAREALAQWEAGKQ